MNTFEALAKIVDQEWQKTGESLASFPDIATQALRGLSYDFKIEDLDQYVNDWLLKNQSLPKQISVHNTFGQPSITLFNTDKFVVDLYFWVDFDTSIHSHGFRGAFRVLHGQSLHETFHTTLVKNLAPDLRIVDMSRVDREKLHAGDIRTIAPGLDLTHRVVHLENPTVTLCVRTVNENELKQWTYLPTGLSVQKNEVSADLLKRIYFYQYLLGRDEAKAAQFLIELFKGLSLSQEIHLYEDVASGAMGLAEVAAQKIVETVVTRHDGSEWWQLYESAHLARMNELSFEHSQDPLERLVGHFANCGLSYGEASEFLEGMTEAKMNAILVRLSS